MSEVDSSYRASGFNRRLGFGKKPVVVVVDFVKAYLLPDNPLYAGVEDARDAAATLLDAARAADVPVIYTVVHYEPGTEGGPFFDKVAGLQNFVGVTEGGEICDELAPEPGDAILIKRFASAFFDTDLKERLDAHGADSVLITGLSTSGCVRATALDAVQWGYIPIVVREAVGDRAAAPHDQALFDLDAKYADVVDLADVTAYLGELPASS